MRNNPRVPARLLVAGLTALPLLLAAAPAGAVDQAAADGPAGTVRINEVESSGGVPGDWVELTSTGTSTVDLSGWIVKDNDDSHVFTMPAGTTLAGGGFLALDVDPVFGLGGADSARLFAPDGTTLVDSYTWTAHAATTYGRCPDGTGEFVTTTAATKGAANACGSGPGGTPAAPWPGGTGVSTVDEANVFGGNMSGLAYQGFGTPVPGILWAVKNGPGTLYRLVRDGTQWTSDPAGGWSSGKALHYPDGTGDPDSEGVALTAAGPAGGVFVSTERNNADSGVSRPEVLRFDPGGPAEPAPGTSLSATREWNLTADLPPVGANLGLEAIAWLPDGYLTAHGFLDEHTGATYRPGDYPGHGDGLFFVGLEANGMVYAYALDQAGGGFTRVATIATGLPAVMDLEFEPETGHLWAVCDDTCAGRSATLDIDANPGATRGRFTMSNVYGRPAGMPNVNNEGFAIAPQPECAAGQKPVFWTDDNNDNGNALRAGTLACAPVALDADGDGINDDVDTAPADPAGGGFSDGRTAGAILAANGHSVTVSDATGPAGVWLHVDAGPVPARVALGAAAVALGPGWYELANSGPTSTVSTLAGGPAVVAVPVHATEVILTVGGDGSVTYTETAAGLTGIARAGEVAIGATGLPVGACGGIPIQTVIVGTTGHDVLTGTATDDLIIGGGGNDVLRTNGGSDCAVTGAGNDLIRTGDGDDWIDAGGGNNVIDAGDGQNTVTTGPANDVVGTGAGNDTINAGGGNNTVVSGAGDDTIGTGAGNDAVDCGAGTDSARTGAGRDANTGGRCETFQP